MSHASELFNIYGQDVILPHVEADFLDIPMVDYWLSFATSLDPNDGRGKGRLNWPQYSIVDPVSSRVALKRECSLNTPQVLMQFTTPESTIVPDTFRAKELAAIDAAAGNINH